MILARPNPRKTRRCSINCSRFDATRRLLSLASRMTGLCRCRGWQWGSLRGFIERGGGRAFVAEIAAQCEIQYGAADCIAAGVDNGWFRQDRDELENWVSRVGCFFLWGARWCCIFWEGAAPAEPSPFQADRLCAARQEPRPPEGVALPGAMCCLVRSCVSW